jgi:sterol desaturase/sphingolipid hydroxylase (fatty acid hydroxylase superfamily)
MAASTDNLVAIPDHLAPKEGELIMFENPVLERLSRIRPWTVLAVFVPAALASTGYSLQLGIGAGRTAGLFLAGIAFWTLFEYLMHKHVFHFLPKGPFQNRLQFIMHGVHHQYPNDKDRLVMPVTVSIPISALLLWLFHFSLGDFAWGFFGGFICGYIAYDMIHYSVHHWINMKSPLMRRIRRHHMAHHFRDTNRGFGVSTPIWDKVFRS